MDKSQLQVKEFHKTFKYTVNEIPTLEVSDKDKELRINLIEEEFIELKEAIEENNIVKIADALGDLKYVIDGAALTFGIDLELVSDEIHRSNMTKVGGYKRENDGKWIKPDTYEPPDIKSILLNQLKGVK